MKTFFTRSILLSALALSPGCAKEAPAPAPSTGSAPVVALDSESGVVEVRAADYAFIAPDEIPSGWTTFEFANRGQEPHFFMLSLMPEGKTLADYHEDVAVPFEKVWDALQKGSTKQEAFAQLGELLPEWYGQVRVMGGIGMVVPGETARTTLRLEPGHYAMECYVKTPQGVFHTTLGMLRALTVTEEVSSLAEPAADFAITLTNDGTTVEGAPAAGHRTIAVHFAEQAPGGLGNDVHLVRLDESTDLAALVSWMDWTNLDGLQSPAPARFLGGAQDMPAGSTAYFEADLEPGRYALVGESPARPLVELTVEPVAD